MKLISYPHLPGHKRPIKTGFEKSHSDLNFRKGYIPPWDISSWFLPRKSAFVEDFSDILTNNKFNKKIGAITPTPYLNSLIPNYLITLINTL